MKMVIKIILLNFMCWVSPSVMAEEPQSGLFIKSCQNGGGELKQYMINNGSATDQHASFVGLTKAAMGNSNVLSQEEMDNMSNDEWDKLAWIYYANHTVPLQNDWNVLWTDVCAFAQTNGGFSRISEAECKVALPELCSSEPTPLVQETSFAKPGPTQAEVKQTMTPVTSPPQESVPTQVVEAALVTSSSDCRFIPYSSVDGWTRDEYGNVKSLAVGCDEPAPSQDQLAADYDKAKADAKARAKAQAEAEARAAEEEARAIREARIEAEAQVAREVAWKKAKAAEREKRSNTTRRKRSESSQSLSRHGSSGFHTKAFLSHYFHDYPEMVEVARCESDFRMIQSGLPNPDGPGKEPSFGYYQINEPTWHETAVKIGFPDYKTNPEHNVGMARYIRETEGVSEWKGYPCG